MPRAQYPMARERIVVDDYMVVDYGVDPDVDRLCGGCRLSVEKVGNSVVVAFGGALWHVEWRVLAQILSGLAEHDRLLPTYSFICTKCSKRVTADTNLLLLSDGSPVCTSCSYSCIICKKPILDEAIMTGDREESYHAACFTCKTCQRRIEELVFAKTSAGIYCMPCHHERMEKKRAKKDKRRVSKDPMSLDSDNNAVHTPR